MGDPLSWCRRINGQPIQGQLPGYDAPWRDLPGSVRGALAQRSRKFCCPLRVRTHGNRERCCYGRRTAHDRYADRLALFDSHNHSHN